MLYSIFLVWEYRKSLTLALNNYSSHSTDSQLFLFSCSWTIIKTCFRKNCPTCNIFHQAHFSALCNTVIFMFLFVVNDLRIKCAPSVRMASFWCQSVTVCTSGEINPNTTIHQAQECELSQYPISDSTASCLWFTGRKDWELHVHNQIIKGETISLQLE